MKQNLKLSTEEVRYIAKLANLVLSYRDVQKFQNQLSETIVYVDRLIKPKTEKVAATSQVTGLVNVFRKDKVLPSLSQKEALANARIKENGYFKTKAIF